MRRAEIGGVETGSELIPLCAAAAVAWGYVVDYPALEFDSAQFDQQLRHMEEHLRRSIPVYGRDQVLKRDFYQAIKRLRPAPLPLEWWVVPQKKAEPCGVKVRSIGARAEGPQQDARVIHLMHAR